MIGDGKRSRYATEYDELRIECRICAKRYSVRRSGAVCPNCGFDPLPDLMHRLDPLALTVRLRRPET